MHPHVLVADTEIATIAPADPADVLSVLHAPVETGDGRSDWCWIRLTNGDLFLGVAPQGATYEALEGKPGTGWGI